MKVRVTFEVDDGERAAVAFHNRQLGKATHKSMKKFLSEGVREKLAQAELEYWEYFSPPPEEVVLIEETTMFSD